jgi:hypothetical protein
MNSSVSKQIAQPPIWSRFERLLVFAVISFYLAILVLPLVPPIPLLSEVLTPIWTGANYLGLWQRYVVFAPPRSYNVYLEATVKLDNGEEMVWKYPRLEQIGLLEKAPKIYYRKFFNEFAHYDNSSVLWPDLARYVARKVYSQTGKRPLQVTLIRYRADIPRAFADPLPPKNETYMSDVLLSCPITDKDLK